MDICLFLTRSLWEFGFLELADTSCLEHEGAGSLSPVLKF